MKALHRPAQEDARHRAELVSSGQPPFSAALPSPSKPFTFRRQRLAGQLSCLWQGCVSPFLSVLPSPALFWWPPAPMGTSSLHTL